MAGLPFDRWRKAQSSGRSASRSQSHHQSRSRSRRNLSQSSSSEVPSKSESPEDRNWQPSFYKSLRGTRKRRSPTSKGSKKKSKGTKKGSRKKRTVKLVKSEPPSTTVDHKSHGLFYEDRAAKNEPKGEPTKSGGGGGRMEGSNSRTKSKSKSLGVNLVHSHAARARSRPAPPPLRRSPYTSDEFGESNSELKFFSPNFFNNIHVSLL